MASAKRQAKQKARAANVKAALGGRSGKFTGGGANIVEGGTFPKNPGTKVKAKRKAGGGRRGEVGGVRSAAERRADSSEK